MAVYVAVQHGDVAVADNPFGFLAEALEVQPVDDAHGAVAAAGAEDGADVGVVELLLQHRGTHVVAAGKLAVAVEQVVGQHHFQLPGAEQSDGGANFGARHLACGSH